ncbi:hypothetical protein KQY30_35030 [Streptomyces sp. GMY02]|uniref:hypothetical protein n=1 Tax=Streptomyces sp. GMY02 TaxID=1333528 RepID=UPI001C2C016B|nr:hypothetical protein [Streptomyces sp. GMY02]QXE38665.1 hypothetical protein KQY30_35030 [Streptomyces sp. GMY02]
MSNSYAQAILRTTDVAEAVRVAGLLLNLADTRELEVDFEAGVSTPHDLERLSEVLPDADWWSYGTARRGSSRSGDSPSECLPIFMSRWCLGPDSVEAFLAAARNVPAMVRWDFSGWPAAPEIGLGCGGTRGAYVTVCVNARDVYLEDLATDHTVYVHVKQIEAQRSTWLAAQVGLQVIGELQMAPV